MATVNGTDYYFIDMQQASGGNITHHLLKDKAGRDAVAPTEATSTASAAHATGSYFFYNGVLYQATADIASGGTIAPNTNCKAVTVGGEVSDLKSALTNATENLSESATTVTGLYIDTSGVLKSVSGADRTICVNALAGKKYRIKKSTVTIMRAGCGSSASLAANAQLVSFVGHNTASADELVIETDETNHYIYIQLFADSDAAALKTIAANIPTLVIVEDYSAEVEKLNDVQNGINNHLLEENAIDLTLSNYARIISSSTGKWAGAENYNSGIFAIPAGEKYVKIAANSTQSAVFAFLKTDAHSLNTTPDYATGSTRTVINANTAGTFAIPSDANYIYVLKDAGGTTYTPQSAVWKKYKRIPDVYPLGLHEKPASESILNIIKRCRQMTDIKWTPAVDLNRLMLVQRGGAPIPDTAETEYYWGTFKAGTEYTGVPYGRVSQTVDSYGYSFGTVGHYIGFDTFVSSVSNRKSRLSTVMPGAVSSHNSLVYATVCSGLVCYALDVSEVGTAQIGSITGLNLVGKLNNNGTLLSDNSIKIGDVLNKYDFHTGIITDIIRDGDGTILFVEISEATVKGCTDIAYKEGQMGGLCIRKGWTKAQLYDPYVWGDYSVYRYTGTVPYTPSPYVNVGDEFDSFRMDHFPIMPYEGEGFAYKAGYIPNDTVKLVITLAGYAYARVFKDGTEISGSPFAVTTTNDEINDISVTEIGEGDYTAYLCNINDGNVSNLSYACHWSIGS